MQINRLLENKNQIIVYLQTGKRSKVLLLILVYYYLQLLPGDFSEKSLWRFASYPLELLN